MRSKEENRSAAIKKLQKDMVPFTVLDYTKCRSDYCKTTKSKLTSTENSSADTSKSPTAESTPTISSADESTDTDLEVDGITDIVEREITFWEDATNEAEETPVSLSTVNQQMLCDIQQCTRCLMGKAAYLIGKDL